MQPAREASLARQAPACKRAASPVVRLAPLPRRTSRRALLCMTAASDAAMPQRSARAREQADRSSTLCLDNIRQTLIRLEDTIIFSLIERAQFARNAPVYEVDAIPVPGPQGRHQSLLEYLLRETEQVHGRIRRYTSPDEHPYFPDDVPELVLPPIKYEKVLAQRAAAQSNVNASILELYLDHLLPEITAPGDDGNYGSAAMNDVIILQALSKRIHYGKFVAEAKYRAQPAEYGELISRGDAVGILELLTDRAVEAKVIERVTLKAATFGQDVAVGGGTSSSGPNGSPSAAAEYKVRPEMVGKLYEQWVMPLTKEVEVLYLLHRLELDGDHQAGSGAPGR